MQCKKVNLHSENFEVVNIYLLRFLCPSTATSLQRPRAFDPRKLAIFYFSHQIGKKLHIALIGVGPYRFTVGFILLKMCFTTLSLSCEVLDHLRMYRIISYHLRYWASLQYNLNFICCWCPKTVLLS